MDLHPHMMAKFKANAYGLATSLSKALESVGSSSKAAGTNHNNTEDHGGQKMLNNNPAHDLQSNYNYSPLNGHDAPPACPSTSSSPPSKSRFFFNSDSKSGTDCTPRCMRPKSQSFREVEADPNEQVSSPVLTSSTNPFLPSTGSTYSTKPFIYNDLKKGPWSPKASNNVYDEDADGYLEELQEIKSNKNKKEYLETNFEGESIIAEDKLSYKMNLGVPMVGMVSNAELVKINTQSPATPTQQLYPVAAIHPSQAVPLSSIFGLTVAMPPQIESVPPPAAVTIAPPPLQSPVDVNPNSKSTDIF